MKRDHTQQQDQRQRQASQELSRQRTRPPIELPGYDPRQFLGAGAYGEVWVAVDKNTGRKVAIKFYTQRSSVDWTLLSGEVEKLVFLSADRYVVQLLDVGWDADPPFYVMEYVDGGSLQEVLDEEGSLPIGEAVELFREIGTGLLHAHGKGVLHCDLKPANILLDQDRRPRLADFGQSRLSHEQTPALGTLFFMAPEQADLKAVPDARWDVYALGALLYCMLTGKSPYRTEKLMTQIDASGTLAGRLETYRRHIQSSSAPTDHRQLPGVDRELADIVDRSLSVDPEQRYPNVQSVLTAVRARDVIRDRRPLLLLGLFGPLLFLSVLAIFGGSTYLKSVNESDQMVRTWAHESSRFAAKFVAEAVARRIDDYYRQVEAQANDPALQEMVQKLLRSAEGSLTTLADNRVDAADRERVRDEFVARAAREPLSARLEALIDQSKGEVDSWFVTDANGVQLVSEIPNEEVKNSTVGYDYSRRAYFHGGDADLPERRHYDVKPLPTTKLSPVFRSEASGTWKVAISTPIRVEGNTIGVIALTVELGNLGDEAAFSATDRRFITIVDGRQGAHRGQILQHPVFNEILAKQRVADPNVPPKLGDYSQYRVPIDELPSADEQVHNVGLYRDPLARAPEGADYAQNWLAAQAPVRLASFDTGLIVLVQENYDLAAEPVNRLGRGLRDRVVWALLLVVAGVLGLWYFVTRALRDPNEAIRRSGGSTIQPSSLHSMETLELPEKLRGRAPRT